MRKFSHLLAGLAALLLLRGDMFPDASNAKLPDARTNLGLGTASAPQLSGINLSGGALTSPTLLDEPGSRTTPPWYGGKPGQRWRLTYGSIGAPILKGGSAFSISEYFKVPVSECGGSYNNTGCASGLLVDVTGDSANGMITSGVTIHASTFSTVLGGGAQALNVVSEALGSATGAVQGAYIQGIRNTTTAAAVMGMELSSANYTALNCPPSYTNIGVCDGEWIASRGNSGTHLSSALHIGNGEVYNTFWEEGITFNNVSVSGTTFMDKSTSTTSINVSGTHATAIHTDAAAGDIDINGPFRLSTSIVPSSSSAAGKTGSIAWDANFIYVCVSTNTWKRVALTTW